MRYENVNFAQVVTIWRFKFMQEAWYAKRRGAKKNNPEIKRWEDRECYLDKDIQIVRVDMPCRESADKKWYR